LLLEAKIVNPTSYALIKASKKGYDKIVALLLNDGRIDPTYEDNTAIRKASERGNIEVIKLLLNDKRVVDSLPKSELHEYEKQVSHQ
jgi:ankyrin repeat protein